MGQILLIPVGIVLYPFALVGASLFCLLLGFPLLFFIFASDCSMSRPNAPFWCIFFLVPPGNPFNIEAVNTGSDTTYDALLERAVAKWESVVVGDLSNVTDVESIDVFGGELSQTSMQLSISDIDDLVIGYEFQSGLGDTVLGHVGPTFLRDDLTPLAGVMVFNSDLFAQRSEEANYLTILQQMGYLLGIGSLWSQDETKCNDGCQVDATEEATYSCAQGSEAYAALRANTTETFGTSTLLVSSDGMDCAAWDGDSFDAQNWVELMAPVVSTRAVLLTNVSLASLQDVSSSYVTNGTAADPIPESSDTEVTWGIHLSDVDVAQHDESLEIVPVQPQYLSDFVWQQILNV